MGVFWFILLRNTGLTGTVTHLTTVFVVAVDRAEVPPTACYFTLLVPADLLWVFEERPRESLEDLGE